MKPKAGILCAVDRELAPFLGHIANDRISRRAMLEIHEGEISGLPLAALYSGVCKVNAAVAAQMLIDRYEVDFIINAGTAGGMDERVRIMDTVVSTESVYHDVAEGILTGFHPWLDRAAFPADGFLLDMARRAAARMNGADRIWFGRMATGEAFIEDEGRGEIMKKYAPLSADMETAAIAHVCHVNRIPFIAVRTITDDAFHRGSGRFEENCARASSRAKNMTIRLLEEIAAAN